MQKKYRSRIPARMSLHIAKGGRHLTGRLGANYRSLPNIRASGHMSHDVRRNMFCIFFFFLIFLVARRVTSMAPEKNVVSADALACFDKIQNETGVGTTTDKKKTTK